MDTALCFHNRVTLKHAQPSDFFLKVDYLQEELELENA